MHKKIYFICPDNKKAAGGLKQLYRQVDVLNENNFEAYILHNKRGFRANWFKNSTKIKYNPLIIRQINYINKHSKSKTFKKFFKLIYLRLLEFISPFTAQNFTKDDILVFPEIYGQKINEIYPEVPKVIFNQNCYYTFNHFNFTEDNIVNPYQNKNTLATIVASKDAESYLSFAFPEFQLYRMRLGINDSIFNYSYKKKKQIAFMPRKLEEDLAQVISILKIRDNLKDWKFVPIDSKPENEVAEILKESAIFLSFNYREGFGLPPVEALACGCIVIGYQGRGGIEYFDPKYSYPIEDRDVISFTKTIEQITKEYSSNPANFEEKTKIASEFVLKEYSFTNEKNDIVKIWSDIIKKQ